MVRDVLCAEKPQILRREIYITAAAAGAGIYVLVDRIAEAPVAATASGFAAAFVIRAIAILKGWSLPTYHPPGGDYPDRTPGT